jgi:hypothetical protein
LVVLQIDALGSLEALVEDAQPRHDLRSFEAVAAVDLGRGVGRVQRLAEEPVVIEQGSML